MLCQSLVQRGVNRLAMRLLISAVAMRGMTSPPPLIISITMTKDVSGDWVTAARYPTMQMATSADCGY